MVAITKLPTFQAVSTGSRIRTAENNTEAQIMLGMDIIGKLRTFIAYKENKIYFTLANEHRGAPQADQKAEAPGSPPR